MPQTATVTQYLPLQPTAHAYPAWSIHFMTIPPWTLPPKFTSVGWARKRNVTSRSVPGIRCLRSSGRRPPGTGSHRPGQGQRSLAPRPHHVKARLARWFELLSSPREHLARIAVVASNLPPEHGAPARVLGFARFVLCACGQPRRRRHRRPIGGAEAHRGLTYRTGEFDRQRRRRAHRQCRDDGTYRG